MPDSWQLGKRHDDVYGCSKIPAPTKAAPAPPLCTLQNGNPDQGINAPGCICGSTTLLLLTVASVTGDAQSCAYTAIPTTTGGSNPIIIPTTTYTSACQACTLVGGIPDHPTCTPIAGCATPAPTLTARQQPPPICSDSFYGTDTSCGGKCNGPKANCECIEAGYMFK